MELQQLKYFKTVAEVGKISAAAEQLFISAPALSASISRLEKELGMPLFTRTNNRILLNAQGKIFLEYVEQVFSTLEVAKETLQESLRPQDSHIHLLSTSTVIWTDLLAIFMAEHPHITLSLSSIQPERLAEAGLPSKYSFLLASREDIPQEYQDELDSAFLLENQLMVMVNKDHPLASAPRVTIDMLMEENVLMPAQHYQLYQQVSELFRQHGQAVPSHDYSFYIRRQMVAMNSGISFVSSHGWKLAAHPDITCVPLDVPPAPWVTRLYWRKSHALTPDEQLFRDFAKDFFCDQHKV